MHAAVPGDQPRILENNPEILPAGVGVFANQHVPTGRFSYVRKNHWPKFSQELRPDHSDRYKIALQLQNLLLLVAYWPVPARLVLAAATHVPVWPIEALAPSYYSSIDIPRPYDSRSLLMRFSDALAVLHAT